MEQANPALGLDEIEHVITSTATPMPGYAALYLDAYEALSRALR